MTARPTDLAALAPLLLAQAKAGGAIVLDGSVLDDAQRSAIRSALSLKEGADLTINGLQEKDIPAAADGALTVTKGSADLLGQQGAPITLVFTAGAGQIDVVITTTLKAGWKLSDSFPSLTGFPFSWLDLTDSHAVYTTADLKAYRWPSGTTTDTVPLDAGLNFLSSVGLGKVPLIGTVLKDLFDISATYRIFGKLSPVAGQSLPVGKLRAEISTKSFGIGEAPNGLTLAKPALAVSIVPADDLNPIQDIDLSIEATFNDVLTVGISIPIVGNTLTISAVPKKSDPSLRNLIEGLPGGKGFFSYLPTDLTGAFAVVGLQPGLEWVVTP